MIIKTIVPQIPKFKYVSQKMKDCFDRQYLTNDGQNLLKFERMLQKYFNSKLKPVVFCNGELSTSKSKEKESYERLVVDLKKELESLEKKVKKKK